MANDDRPGGRNGVLRLLGRIRPSYLYWAAVLVVFATAVWVFQITPRTRDGETGHRFFDSVFRAIQLFLINLDGSTLAKPLPLQVYAVAFLAALMTFVGTLAIFVRGVSEWVRRFLQTRDSRHRAVLLGFGRVNRAAARALRLGGYQVTAADISFDDGAKRLAARDRVLLIPVDLSDPDSLTSLQIDKSDRVVVALGSDMANVELGTSLIRPGGPRIFIHAADVQLASSLRQLGRDGTPFQRNVEAGADKTANDRGAGTGWVFSLKEEGARRLMARAQLPLLARSARQERVHLVIFGFGDQGRAVLLEALLACTAIRLGPPAITVVDRDAEALKRQFAALRPRLMDGSLPAEARPDIAFVTAHIDRLDMAARDAMDAIEARGRPTAYVVTCGEDATNLDAGLRLEQAMRRSERLAAPIYLALLGEGLGLIGPLARRRSDLLRTFGGIDEAATEAPLQQDDPDDLPRELHDAYNKQAIASGLMTLDQALGWEDLTETMRESNRRAVRHARTKLLDLGFRWHGSAEPRFPRLAVELASHWRATEEALQYGGVGTDLSFEQSTDDGSLMARSVHAEHSRWLIDRAMDDWKQVPEGGARSNQQRVHRNMVSFADLTAENKRFDAMFIRGMLERLSSSGHKDQPARRLRPGTLFIDVDGATSPLPTGVTDLALGWSNDVTALSPANAAQLVEQIRVWSAGEAASRCTIYLGRPPTSRKQGDKVPMAEVLNRIAQSLDPLVVYEVVHASGLGISEEDPGVGDDGLRAMLGNMA
jgi:hypothetical protein